MHIAEALTGPLDLSESSSRGRKRKQEVEQAKPPVKDEPRRPSGPPPSAVVRTRHRGQMMLRQARGYSTGEVAGAELVVGQARSWGLLIDDRRGSVLGENVASLRGWAPPAEKRVEVAPKGEVQKLEREVEKEVRKIEEEARKVEEEVVEKIEAPIKKRAKKKEAAKEKPAKKQTAKKRPVKKKATTEKKED